jgi:hypothetical protein
MSSYTDFNSALVNINGIQYTRADGIRKIKPEYPEDTSSAVIITGGVAERNNPIQSDSATLLLTCTNGTKSYIACMNLFQRYKARQVSNQEREDSSITYREPVKFNGNELVRSYAITNFVPLISSETDLGMTEETKEATDEVLTTFKFVGFNAYSFKMFATA